LFTLLALILGPSLPSTPAQETPPPVFKRFNLRCLAPLLQNLDAEAPENIEQAFLAGPASLATPLPKIGAESVDFPITTTSPEAQTFFNQGVAHLHTLSYPDAERAFRTVIHLDPDCAMGYWGLAMANELRPKRARLFAKSAIGKTNANRPQLEQRWIDILAQYYQLPAGAAPATPQTTPAPEDNPEALAQRSADRIRAYENMVIDFPDQIEAKAFLLRQLVLDEYRAGLPISSHLAVARLADDLARTTPNHPSRHYTAFLWLNRRPEQGLPAADAAPPLAPDVADLWRYAGEAYAATGQYSDAIPFYEAAVRIALRHLSDQPLMPSQIQNLTSNFETLIDNLGAMGRINEALFWAESAIALPRENFAPPNGLTPEPLTAAAKRLYAQTLMRAELWEPLLDDLDNTPALQPTGPLDFTTRAYIPYWKSLALLLLDRPEEALALDQEIETVLHDALNEGVSKNTEQTISNTRKSLRDCHHLLTGENPEPFPPDQLPLHLTPELLAQLYLKAGLHGNALAILKENISTQPHRVLPTAAFCDLALQQGQTKSAFVHFDPQLRIDAGLADENLPALTRLDTVAEQKQFPIPWTLTAPSSPAPPRPQNHPPHGPPGGTPQT
ncbi:MAG: tetratricopeptide repeat protein, partial [Verrucomicrobiota bacterium]